jgi:hypothetical protein
VRASERDRCLPVRQALARRARARDAMRVPEPCATEHAAEFARCDPHCASVSGRLRNAHVGASGSLRN